jgi:glycosyltransferase involved in cell wall biosynthesis
MQVSVITPNYNCAAFLPAAIESVRSQTFPDWELIIADDGSTDDSRRIIEYYARSDTRIRLVTTAAPSGSPLAPRNLALRQARGRYLAFLDSDDLWLPGKLAQQLPLFADAQTAIVFSNYEKVDPEGTRSNRVVHAPKTVTYRDLLKGNCIGNLTAMYDSEKVGKRYFSHPGHEDYALWLDILAAGYIARNTGTVEALYRIRRGSVSARKGQAMQWQWDIYRNARRLSPLRSAYFFGCYLTRGLWKYLQ